MVVAARRGNFLGLFGPKKHLIQFWPLDPRPEDIHIASIARGLGGESRYGGQTIGFWPVAAHCVETTDVPMPDGSPPTAEERFKRLMHDGSEGLLMKDLPSPAKHDPEMQLDRYREADHAVMNAIADRYRLPHGFHEEPSVKFADMVVRATEIRDLRQPETWERGPMPAPLPWTLKPTLPFYAERRFLRRFFELAMATGRDRDAHEALVALANLESMRAVMLPVEVD